MSGATVFLGGSSIQHVFLIDIDQRPVISRFPEIRSALLKHGGEELASLLAEPILTRGNGQSLPRVDWYTSLQGKVTHLDELDPGAAKIVREKLVSRLTQLRSLLDQSEIGPVVAAALNVLSSASILSVGEEPVLKEWGLLPSAVDRAAHFQECLGQFVPGWPTPPISRTEWQAGSDQSSPPENKEAHPTTARPAAASTAPEYEGPRHNPERAPAVACAVALIALGLLLIPGVLRLNAAASSDRLSPADQAAIASYAKREGLLKAALVTPCSPDTLSGGLLQPPLSQIAAAPRAEQPSIALPRNSGGSSAYSPAPSPPQQSSAPSDLASRIEAGVVLVVTENAVGSGFFISSDLIVTNQHVTDRGGSILVANKLTGVLSASLVGQGRADGLRDFAVLRVPRQPKVTPFELAAAGPPLSPIIAAGFPGLYLATDPVFQRLKAGEAEAVRDLTPVFQSGVISHLQRHAESEATLVLHSAEISPGSSGGPLVDYCGRVTGVNTFLRGDREVAVTARYAIGADALQAFLSSLGFQAQRSVEPCRPQAMPQVAAGPAGAPPPAPASETVRQ